MASDLAVAGRLIEREARSGASPGRPPVAAAHWASRRHSRRNGPLAGPSHRRAGVTHAVRDLPTLGRPARQGLSRLSGNTAAYRRSRPTLSAAREGLPSASLQSLPNRHPGRPERPAPLPASLRHSGDRDPMTRPRPKRGQPDQSSLSLSQLLAAQLRAELEAMIARDAATARRKPALPKVRPSKG